MRTPEGSPGRAEDQTTPSGIPLAPVYATTYPQELPGEYPFTRGIHADMYRGRLWTFRQYAGFGNAKETNRRYRFLLSQGQSGLSVAFDLPSQIGYDSDDPMALGEVGKVGVPISSLDDVEELFDGIALEKVSVSMTINSTAPIVLAFLIVTARRRGVPLEALRGTVQNDMLKEFISRRTYRLNVRASLRLVVDTFDYCRHNLTKFNPISISGYHMREAGCNAVQEIGFTLANALAYFEAARERGLPLDDLARRVSFFWSAHNHFLEEIAKFRAARKLWAELLRERFSIKEDSSCRMRFHTQTAGSTLSAREPENNSVRVTVQALAAVLGGTQSLHTNSMDEALGLPSARAARTALRTQQVLAFESGIADVADPFGGAPAVEALTDAVCAGARQLIEEIEARGGAIRAVEEGFQKAIIEEEAYRYQREVEAGTQAIVGVNRFRDETPPNGPDPDALEPEVVEPALEAERIRELRARKSQRDPEAIASLCRDLKEHLAAGRNAVEGFIRCAEGGVTLGEMSRVLVEVFGEHAE